MQNSIVLIGAAMALLQATSATSAESCSTGEKRIRPDEECIPASLFNYLYCLQQSGGGKVEVIRKSGDENAGTLEIQLSGKGSGVVIKGEAGGGIKKSDITKATRELQEKLDPGLASNCKYFANAAQTSKASPSAVAAPLTPSTTSPRPAQQRSPITRISPEEAPPFVNDDLKVNEASVRTLYAEDFCQVLGGYKSRGDKYSSCYAGTTLERCQGAGVLKSYCKPRPPNMHCYMSKAMGGMLNCYDNLGGCQGDLKAEREHRAYMRASEPVLSKNCETFRLF